jgi:hypothetical protein
MRLAGGSDNLAGNRYDNNLEKGTTNVEFSEVTRIPFKIDDEIMIRSMAVAAHRTKTTVVGAVHGDFILILEPIMKVNRRLQAVFDGSFEAIFSAGIEAICSAISSALIIPKRHLSIR